MSAKTGRELLIEFKQTRRQEPFEEIVRRYGPMVFGICFDVTRNRHDAEDAAQAVFLALAMQCRKDASIQYLGRWLQQVARRTSLDIRRSRQRRGKREQRIGAPPDTSRNPALNDQADLLNRQELHLVLRDEVSQLPARYRTPLILYYFGGLSQSDMAAELGCSARTLAVRLFRGRQMLSKSLSRRGITVAGAALTLAMAETVRGAVSDAIFASTANLATSIALGKPIGSAVSAQVLNLACGAGAAMPAWHAMRIAFVLAVLVGSAIASAPDAFRSRLPDISLPNLFRFDATRLFERMLRGIIPNPQLTDASAPPSAEKGVTLNYVPPAQKGVRYIYMPSRPVGDDMLPPPAKTIANSPAISRGSVPPARLPGIGMTPTAPTAPRGIVAAPPTHAPLPLVAQTPVPPAQLSHSRVARRPVNFDIAVDSLEQVAGDTRNLTLVSDAAQPAFVTRLDAEIRSGHDAENWYSSTDHVTTNAQSTGDFAILGHNRLQLTLHDLPVDADASVSLVSAFDDNAPSLPEGHRLLAMWKLDSDAEFSSADLLVRYNSKLVETMGLPEEHLKLWVYDDQWIRLADASFGRDLVADLLWARATGDFTYIAVSAPEPGGLFILTIAGGALLLCRNRRPHVR